MNGLHYGIMQSLDKGGVPLKSDLNLHIIGRSGLDMVDVYGNNAKILPSCAYFDGTSYYYRTGIRPGTADLSGFIEVEFYYDGTNRIDFFSITTITTATRYFLFYIATDGKLNLQIKEPAANPVIFTIAYRSTNALSVGYHKARITHTGSALQFNVDGSDVAGGYVTGSTPKWIGNILSTSSNNIAFGAYKMSNTTTVSTGKIYSINYNNVNKWILHGQGKYALDYGATSYAATIDIPWVGSPSYRFDVLASQYMLDTGYSVFTKTGEPDEIVPYQSAGVISPTANRAAYMSTYTRYKDVDGAPATHNNAPSVIDFDYAVNGLAANFDRSNATKFSNDARTGYEYNALKPFQWRPQDIFNPKIYYKWQNTGNKRVFCKVTQEDEIILTNNEILSYNANKINSNVFKVVKYCGIDDYFIKENGVPIYDVNGDMTFLTDFVTANNFLASPTIDKFAIYERGVDFTADSAHFRIPFCEVDNDGIYIAGTDVRHDTSSDFTKTDSAIKLSNDGETFGAGVKVILNNEVDAKSRVGSNIILNDKNTGRVYIFSHSVDNHTEEGLSGVVINDLIWDFFYRYSDDNGVTWSNEISLKSLLSASGANLMLPGCSNKGIVLSNGTLVVPIYEARHSTNQLETGTDWQVRGGFIYSTDGGTTWLRSNLIEAPISECSVIEYEPNKIMLIGRAFVNYKYFYTTSDLGQTWTAATANKTATLSGTPTQMGTHKLNKTLLVSCPDNESDRSDVTLFISKKYRAFIPFLLIDTDVTYGYTCMCSDANETKLFLIYEKANYTYWVNLTDYLKYFK
jgi:hypothetical protein